MKTCPKCNKEYPDKAKFCLEDGTLLEEKASGLTAMSGGKIVAGGDVTQNVSHHSETNIYNQDESKQVKTCVVSGRKAVITEGNDCKTCGEWALNEHFDDPSGQCRNCSDKQSAQKANDYRSAVLEALNDDLIIDADERKTLVSLSEELDISDDRAIQIEEEIRGEIFSHSATLSPSDKLLFKRSVDSLYLKGDASKAFGKLGTLAESYPEHQEIARMYVLCSIEADPELGLEFLSRSPCFREDSARKSLRKIELYEKLGKTAEVKAEEKRALQAFGTDPLIKAKALERMIDLYLEEEQEEEELDAVKEVAGTWEKPGPEDEPYLHFVDAYLGVAMKEESELQPEGGGPKANYFCSRKLRTSPDLFSFESDFDSGMLLAEEEKWEEAVERFRRAAEGGHAAAQNELAEMYYEGKGVAKDLGKAYEWFREAACQGDATGQKNLAVLYYEGEGVTQGHAEAFEWFAKAAAQGNAEAQRNLAEMYRDGEGVERDYAKAFKWFSKAAENRDGNLSKSNEKYELARMYENGRGCEKDASKASKLYREIANEGVDGRNCNLLHLRAMIAVGNDFKAQGDYDLARKWFEQAAQNVDNPELGWVGLGELVEEESADHSAAIKWYRKAAERGNPCGMYELARCMESSSGAERDEPTIKKWYEEAARADHPGGLFWMSQKSSEAGEQEECERLLYKAAPQELANTKSRGFNHGIEKARQKLLEMDGSADGKSKGDPKRDSKGKVPFNRHAAGYVKVATNRTEKKTAPKQSQKKKEDPADPSFDTEEIREKIESLINRNSDVEKATYVSDLTSLGTVLKKNKILGLEGRYLLKEIRALVIDMGFYLVGDSHGGGERVLTAAEYKEKRDRHDRKVQKLRRQEKTWDVIFFLLFTAMMVTGLGLLCSFGEYCRKRDWMKPVLNYLDSKGIPLWTVGMILLFIASLKLGKLLGSVMTRNRYVTKMNFDSHPIIASSPWWLSTICFMVWKFPLLLPSLWQTIVQ